MTVITITILYEPIITRSTGKMPSRDECSLSEHQPFLLRDLPTNIQLQRHLRRVLVNIRLHPRCTLDNLLHKLRQLTHDIDPVCSLAQAALNHSLSVLPIARLADPGEADGGGLRPVAVGIALGLGVLGLRVRRRASEDDLTVFRDASHRDLSLTIGRWRREVHHHRGEIGRVEVGELPSGS